MYIKMFISLYLLFIILLYLLLRIINFIVRKLINARSFQHQTNIGWNNYFFCWLFARGLLLTDNLLCVLLLQCHPFGAGRCRTDWLNTEWQMCFILYYPRQIHRKRNRIRISLLISGSQIAARGQHVARQEVSREV